MAKQVIKISIPDLCALVREELKKKKLPSELRLNKWTNIIDLEKFFNTHLTMVETTKGRLLEPYKERLSQALILVGIDTTKLATRFVKDEKAERKYVVKKVIEKRLDK